MTSALPPVQAVRWSDDGHSVRILDQRCLPEREVYRDLRTVSDVCDAIATLAVRGAPAIGIAGAMGLTLALNARPDDGRVQLLEDAAEQIRATRPTAVNLSWALDRMLARARGTSPSDDLRHILHNEASRILDEDRDMCRRLGELGSELIADGGRVLTHCNTGALATGGIGTALAAIYVAIEQGKRVSVYADETRPLLQGSRLTAWELQRAGIPVTVLVDGAAATLMRAGQVDACFVGADRIAANGDVANKVGTYALALAARSHGVPFYVVAPTSTFDPSTRRGEEIVIEKRKADEVRRGFGSPTAPPDVDVYNPAFDVTPADLITAIVSDRAIHRPPFDFGSGGR
ncbi:MAG TPA: S-methyl-5-thioribose-1-phosphate isomerase [Gemmatimonadaceae bacterium]|jgi:methylthioribose-1-phosphate isomerase|nr:S-methyl-5-thioribose-1-phosphate isomerase [Gemmatimonadaceae bacterium]